MEEVGVFERWLDLPPSLEFLIERSQIAGFLHLIELVVDAHDVCARSLDERCVIRQLDPKQSSRLAKIGNAFGLRAGDAVNGCVQVLLLAAPAAEGDVAPAELDACNLIGVQAASNVNDDRGDAGGAEETIGEGVIFCCHA